MSQDEFIDPDLGFIRQIMRTGGGDVKKQKVGAEKKKVRKIDSKMKALIGNIDVCKADVDEINSDLSRYFMHRNWKEAVKKMEGLRASIDVVLSEAKLKNVA